MKVTGAQHHDDITATSCESW